MLNDGTGRTGEEVTTGSMTSIRGDPDSQVHGEMFADAAAIFNMLNDERIKKTKGDL